MLDLDKNDLMEQIRKQLEPEMTDLFFSTYIKKHEFRKWALRHIVSTWCSF